MVWIQQLTLISTTLDPQLNLAYLGTPSVSLLQVHLPQKDNTFWDFKVVPTYRVATSQLDLNSLTFPYFFGALFPDFPWPHDTDLMGIAWYPERGEEKFCTCNHWVFTRICLEVRDKLWVTSARSFSLTFPNSRQKILKFTDFPWLSRRSKFSLIFPDGGNPASCVSCVNGMKSVQSVCLCMCLLGLFPPKKKYGGGGWQENFLTPPPPYIHIFYTSLYCHEKSWCAPWRHVTLQCDVIFWLLLPILGKNSDKEGTSREGASRPSVVY